MLHPKRILLVLLAAGLHLLALAGQPVSWAFSAVALGGDTVQVRLQSTCDAGWHIYALGPAGDEGPLPTEVRLMQDDDFQLAGPVQEQAPQEMLDRAFGMQVRYHDGASLFTQAIMRSTPKAFTVQGTVEYMACNEVTCLPPTTQEFTLEIPPLK